MSKKWNNEIAIPRDNGYILRVIEEGFAPSKSSGKPMITLKHEIVAPEEVEVAGEKITIAGVKANLLNYLVTKSIDEEGKVDESKSSGLKEQLVDAYKNYGVDLQGAEVNVDNPPLGFKGKLVYAVLDDEAKAMRKTPTKEQLDKGQKIGDVMLHPQTKLPMIEHWPKIVKIICPAEQPANTPY